MLFERALFEHNEHQMAYESWYRNSSKDSLGIPLRELISVFSGKHVVGKCSWWGLKDLKVGDL